MKELISSANLKQTALNIWVWIQDQLLVSSNLVQLLVIGLVLVLARIIGQRLKPWLNSLIDRLSWADKQPGLFLRSAVRLTTPLVALILVGIAQTLAVQMGWSSYFLKTAASLLAAWVVIRQTSAALGQTIWAKLIAVSVMTIVTLNILNLLHPTMAFLDGLAIKLGQVRLSVLDAIKGLLILAILIRLAQISSGALERKLKSVSDLTPSVQVLLSKLARMGFFTAAGLITLSSVGVNLTVFALFGGAMGVGLGFGLQKIFSNLVSGIILLLDRSIKPGDVIEVGQTFGRIRSLGARYVAVVTRDGTEYLIPNEDLITNRVVNWTYSDNFVRLKIPVGVSCGSDVRLAQELAVEAAESVDRVLARPEPVCHFKKFGDSSVDLELRIWISDAENGVTNVSSAVRLAIWDRFKENGVAFPFPQRDVHLMVEPNLEITVRESSPKPSGQEET
ncbi:MAG: mechanosensitive ion channel [Deltaproteobacteria bacterium]|nr:mechanosensitive ion channel [Deltaproteobacteria bacterium]